MPSTVIAKDLWTLVRGNPHIDSSDLILAIEAKAQEPALDFRTSLLIRDCFLALANRNGTHRTRGRFSSEVLTVIDRSISDDLGPCGFPSLELRIMDAIEPEVVHRFFRELGSHLRQPTRLDVGGSIALILRRLLRRNTEDIDAVDEVPPAIRLEHDFLEELSRSHGLRLTHFQSHFLPDGWQTRTQLYGDFQNLDVYLVSEWDITLGKLFSARRKDRDDLRVLFDTLKKQDAIPRLQSTAKRLLAEPALRAAATTNWYVLFGEPLPA